MAKTCNGCGTNDMAVMPIAQHEKDQQRLMSIIKKQFVAIIVLICLLFGSFGLFVWYESLYETISYKQDGEGINNVNLGKQGDFNNGSKGALQEKTKE